jgi:hypothetical protein
LYLSDAQSEQAKDEAVEHALDGVHRPFDESALIIGQRAIVTSAIR